MKRRSVWPPTTSASSTSTCGSAAARRASISACKLLINPPSDNKKAGERPLSDLHRRARRAQRKLWGDDSTVHPVAALEESLQDRVRGGLQASRDAAAQAAARRSEWSR